MLSITIRFRDNIINVGWNNHFKNNKNSKETNVWTMKNHNVKKNKMRKLKEPIVNVNAKRNTNSIPHQKINQSFFSNFTFNNCFVGPSGDIFGVFVDDKWSLDSRSKTSFKFLFKIGVVVKVFIELVVSFLSKSGRSNVIIRSRNCILIKINHII